MQGGLHVLEVLVRGRGPHLPDALWVLCCLLHNNAWVRNAARQSGGFAGALLSTVAWAGVSKPSITVCVLHACCVLCGKITWPVKRLLTEYAFDAWGRFS